MEDEFYFSIIIPCYNVEKFVYASVHSVLNQSFKNFEIIIVNDGSTDNTLQILQSIYKENTNCIKLINQKNQGIAATRNRGLSEVNGKYVIYLDSDDTLDNDTLEYLHGILKDSEVDCVSYGIRNVFEDGRIEENNFVHYSFETESAIVSPPHIIRSILTYTNISSSVVDKAFNSTFLKKMGSNPFMSGRIYEDQLFMIQSANYLETVLVTKKVFMNYLNRDGSIMRSANSNVPKDFYYLMNSLWENRLNYSDKINDFEQILCNYLLIQSITFYQSLNNSKNLSQRDYKNFVEIFKSNIWSKGINIIYQKRYSSLGKRVFAWYMNSDFSNFKVLNKIIFSIKRVIN